MIKVLSKFFDFCQKENSKKFKLSVLFTFFEVLFDGLKIPAMYLLFKAVIEKDVSSKTAWMCFGLMVAGILGNAIVNNKCTMLQTEGGYDTCSFKRIEIAEHLRYVPMGYFNKNTLGQVISVTTNTLQAMEAVATRVVMVISKAYLNTLIVVMFIFAFDYRIGLAIVPELAVYLFFNNMLIKKSNEISEVKSKTDENLVDRTLEYIMGITEVKNYKLSGEKSKELNQANKENAKVNFSMEKKAVPLIGIQDLIVKFVGITMSYLSIRFFIGGSMTMPVCIVMITMSYIMFGSLSNVSAYSTLLRSVEICMGKVNTVMESPQMELDGDENKKDEGNISVKNVEFSYENRKIIDGVSFEIKDKTTTAIVGPSGGGKTTLANLLARFWDVDAGEIKLNGKNIKDYSYDSLISHFSFVFQNVFLFKNTIAENIAFGRDNATKEEIVEAAKKACCHDFIMALPNGYDTVIGDEGVNLSGGERQRISIARAILKDAPIVILDEATANVDPENESELVKAIESLTKEKTIIMIAHRLKTVRKADQILVVSDGKIEDHGTHKELISREGTYKRFIEGRRKAVSWQI